MTVISRNSEISNKNLWSDNAWLQTVCIIPEKVENVRVKVHYSEALLIENVDYWTI